MLPIEIPPFKRYTLKVTETCCTSYSDADLPHITLRRAVERMGAGHPHHSSLHGWLGALGERALGRMDRVSGYLPVSVLIAETAKRHNDGLPGLWGGHYPVAECKYRSQKRFEQLESCARLFTVAARLFPKDAHRLFEWEQWLQDRLHVAAWTSPARTNCTAFQQHPPGGAGICSALSSQDQRKPRKEKSHAARSPP